jgi:Protein kinase domain
MKNTGTAEALIQLQKRMDAMEIMDSKAIICADYVQEKEQQNRITFGWTPSAPEDFTLFPAVLFDENIPAAEGSEINDVKPYWKEILETPLIDGLHNGYETGRLPTKTPDVAFYPKTIERPSAADFVAFGDCKGSDWTGTLRSEIGQVMLHAHRILDAQPQRLHVYGFITNNWSVVLVRGYQSESRPFAVCWFVSSALTFEAGMKAFFYLMIEDNGFIGSPTVCGIPLAIKRPLRPGGSCRAFTATYDNRNVVAKLYGDGDDAKEEARMIAAVRSACTINSQNAEFPVVVAVDSPWLLVTPVGTPFVAATFSLEHLKMLLRTLKTVHEAKIVHRDVRFSNIFLVEDGRVLLNDWGSSIHYEPLTRAAVAGCPAPYCHPDLVGARSCFPKPKYDLYSLVASTASMLAPSIPKGHSIVFKNAFACANKIDYEGIAEAFAAVGLE